MGMAQWHFCCKSYKILYLIHNTICATTLQHFIITSIINDYPKAGLAASISIQQKCKLQQKLCYYNTKFWCYI